MRAESDQAWANAAVSVPGMMYWTSGEAPEASRWNPFDPSRGLLRPAPVVLRTIDSTYINDAVAAFTRTGFHGPLNYYRAVEPFTRHSAAFAGAKIRQPSMFLAGTLDGLNLLAQPSPESMRSNLTDLHSFIMLDGVGHGHSWKPPMQRTRRCSHFYGASELWPNTQIARSDPLDLKPETHVRRQPESPFLSARNQGHI